MAFGRFERTPAHHPMSEINVTPLVDVMMVLLVIFILTAPLMLSSLNLALPQAQSGPATHPPQAIRLALDAQAQLFLEGQPLERHALREALRARVAQARDAGARTLPEVQLQADASVPYGQVVGVMDEAQQAGLTQIAFVTERRERAAAPAAKP